MTVKSTTEPHVRGRRAAALAAAGLLLAAGALAACSTNASQSSSDNGRACTDLTGTSIPASEIGLPTRGGQVTEAKLIPAKGNGTKAVAEYCEVGAILFSVDTGVGSESTTVAAPDIKLKVGLPTNWNGKSFMQGGGTYDGYLNPPGARYAVDLLSGEPLISRGYAFYTSDSGHQDPTYYDASFAINDEALRNYTGDSLKKTHDAAMFLMNAHYGKKPDRTYFFGKSSGGREALQVAQRWPTDFNGIVSLAPGWNAASLDLEFGYLTKIFSQPGAFLNPAKQTLLHNAVMGFCDGQDGVRDGLISNPDGCHYDPHAMRCPDGADSGDTCLSDTQINAVIAADAPLKLNYPLASGETGYPGFPLLSGMELRDPYNSLGAQPPINPISKDNWFMPMFWEQWVRGFITKDMTYNALTVDPQNPGQWQQRISELTKMQDINNPDLGAFAKNGGKLLVIQGVKDSIVSYRSTVDYFNRVKATMGPASVHDFARLYLVPGADHYFGIKGSNLQLVSPLWDWATALDNWVQHGQAPQNPVTTDNGSEVAGRTRPLCEYPAWPKYNGTGDVNQASSFTCVTQP